jgi:hypothetical protein
VVVAVNSKGRSRWLQITSTKKKKEKITRRKEYVRRSCMPVKDNGQSALADAGV